MSLTSLSTDIILNMHQLIVQLGYILLALSHVQGREIMTVILVFEQSLEMWTEREQPQQLVFASASSGAVSEPPENRNEPSPFPTRPQRRLRL
ncbi:hypothetical protein H920_19801 [Fukomys damarensis]|uniref:Uncharacterized protein n=1 Tax=Fukomys damarensis TaxID=885580 RepID=A0A091CM13_FUKDA|nr:hypothetical protein H920_19801 [Fukomys damarensis]